MALMEAILWIPGIRDSLCDDSLQCVLEAKQQGKKENSNTQLSGSTTRYICIYIYIYNKHCKRPIYITRYFVFILHSTLEIQELCHFLLHIIYTIFSIDSIDTLEYHGSVGIG